ncbi:hypothetical protein D3C76_912340 [compost metagenome]
MRPFFLRPEDALGDQEAPQAPVDRLHLQERSRFELYVMSEVIDPDVQVVLFLAHPLVRQLHGQAQQAQFLAVALGAAILDKTQGASAGAVGGQRCQAQHVQLLGLHICPRPYHFFGNGRLGSDFGGVLGLGIRHYGDPLSRSKPATN